jgi:hypothetical protein
MVTIIERANCLYQVGGSLGAGKGSEVGGHEGVRIARRQGKDSVDNMDGTTGEVQILARCLLVRVVSLQKRIEWHTYRCHNCRVVS